MKAVIIVDDFTGDIKHFGSGPLAWGRAYIPLPLQASDRDGYEVVE